MTVDIDLFVETMTNRWEGQLGNRASNPLQQIWRQIGSTFNRQIEGKSRGELQVLQPPTGTGKTQGVAVYCSMLSHLPTKLISGDGKWGMHDGPYHPGVLIVTRLKTEANELAKTINELSGTNVAKACHGENKLSRKTTLTTGVLVVTHNAYLNALKDIYRENRDTSQWGKFINFHDVERRLVIIDEALDLVDDVQLSVERLKQAFAYIPENIAVKHPKEIGYLYKLRDWLLSFSSSETKEQMLPSDCMLSELPDFTNLKRSIRGLRLDISVRSKNDDEENRELRKVIYDVLDDIQALSGQWILYSKAGQFATLNTSRCLLPDDHAGAVILDATASTNLIYQLFEDRAHVIPAPSGARKYENVTLKVSTDHRVGKYWLLENADRECDKLITELTMSVGNDRKVFVCTHKDLAYKLKGYQHEFSEYDVAHWGAIDGRNDWKYYNTAVMFGLPYRGNTWATTTFMAAQGPQNDDWLVSSKSRSFKHYPDIKRELEVGVLSTNLIQAINRVQCRRVIDEHGNCAPTTVYLLLPSGDNGNKILHSIKGAMPGIQVEEWNYVFSKKKVRKSKYDGSLLAYLNQQLRGKYSASEIKDILAIPKTSYENLIKKIKDDSSEISTQLTNIGIRYEVTGAGRGARSYFIKS